MREASKRRAIIRAGIPVASALLAPAVYAQEAATAGAAATPGGLQEVVVTAEKRTETLQSVPVSIEALSNEKLAQLNISDIDDYVEYLSGVTTVKGLGQGGTGIGTTHVYMRGVVSGQDGNHSASQPTVGTYLDEQPVTTIDGTVDIHMYDIARIEVLAGPQGTLYGASSEAGTIRIITNKPDTSHFYGGVDVSGNSVDHGGQGWTAEGFANIPVTPWMAVRLVGWDEHDAGYIHNVAGTDANAGIFDGVRGYPVGTGCPCNPASPGFGPIPGTENSNVDSQNPQYNTASTIGGRATVAINIGDNWTVTPAFMGQQISSNGFFGYDPAMGDLDVARFGYPDSYKDSWTQTALTVEGKVSDFDITAAGGWFVRNEHTLSDYSDYSYFYDKYFASGCFWVNNTGYNFLKANPGAQFNCEGAPSSSTKYPDSYYTAPQEYVITNGHYNKWFTELRATTPQQYPVKGLLGLFAQRQVHEIWEQYTIPGAGGNPLTYNPQGLAQGLTIPTVDANTIWLTDEERVDRDSAAFGQVTWDIGSHWQVIGGIRFYEYKNSLQGFYGYSANYQDLTGFYPGMNICIPGQLEPFHGAPCTDLNETVSGNGRTYRGTLTYKFNPDALMYFTYSTGFRPGGVNRVFSPQIDQIFPPYKADTLTNWEVGWKTEWLNHRLVWNGALFLENWDNFQFLFLGPNSVTVVQNAASAQIKGVETNLQWAATNQFLLTGSATYLHAVTTANYCGPGDPPYVASGYVFGVGPFQNNYIPGTTSLTTDCPNQNLGYRQTASSGFSATSINVGSGPEAPEGTQLPVAPKFKANLVARYTFPLANWDGHFQAAYVYQSSSEPLLRIVDQVDIGKLPSYGLLNLATGAVKNGFSTELTLQNVTDKRANLTRFVECATTTCTQPYVVPTQPFTVGLHVGYRF
jgi:iron complex outermembrane recepter protein